MKLIYSSPSFKTINHLNLILRVSETDNEILSTIILI